MRKYAVIVAGGSGTRMGGGIPKQFRDLCGRPVLWWSMKAFHDEDPDTSIVLVLPSEHISLWKELLGALPEKDRFCHQIAEGGETRSESVSNGLSIIGDEDAWVAVHDGARPLVTAEIISRGWHTILQNNAAIPAVPVTDSLREVSGNLSHSVDRSKFMAVQTPQFFSVALLKEAYGKSRGKSFTDDAAVIENAGGTVTLFEGSPLNLKITNPQDLVIAEVLMNRDA